MQLFGYEIKKVTPFDLKKTLLDKAQANAETALINARLELRHHRLLLETLQLEHSRYAPDSDKDGTRAKEREFLEEAIDRDIKSIRNWENQLKAISYERNT